MSVQTLVPAMLFLVLGVAASAAAAAGEDNFTFHGFTGAGLVLSDLAAVTSGGLLQLTNNTAQKKGHAFFPTPFRLRDPSNGNKSRSFSTSFVFAIRPEYPDVFGHGIAFVLSPTVDLAGSVASQHLGLPEMNNSSHVVAVEFDIVKNDEFGDISNNHVGIDINSLTSVNSTNASYVENGERKALDLKSGDLLLAWVDYDGLTERLEVTVSPAGRPRPETLLLSYTVDVSSIVTDQAYVGFSASTGAATATQYVLGWSFRLGGKADELDLSKIPSLPQVESAGQNKWRVIVFASAVTVAVVVVLLLAITGAVCVVRRRRRFAEVLEDWEEEYGPHRFSYKDLFRATRGFSEAQLLGKGGFGRVYRGALRSSKVEVAVKKISHDSHQGMREFVSEIVSMGRLRHRNLVQLLGYCRRQGELLLVYDFMPNGSLDRFLFDASKPRFSWKQRFHIVKGVASGLLYLHDGWEQVVVHRDIKASNILLDAEMNGRLSDFGLARLYDHGTNPQTTHIVGTLGYMAPELTKTGKATTATDLYAFGAFLLEVACGRRPMEIHSSSEEPFLVDWVLECWKRGAILEAADPKLWTDDDGKGPAEEIELVLMLGLLCSHPEAAARPTMRQVVQYLEGDAPLPVMSPAGLDASSLALRRSEGFDDFVVSVTYPSSSYTTFGHDSSPGDSCFSRSH